MNCKHTTVVVRAGEYRLVSYCEHGTIHINWNLATLHLRPAGFERLVNLLKQAKAAPDAAQIGDKKYYSLVRQENGCSQLWVGDVALFFEPAEFSIFSDLLLNARQRLGKKLPQPSARAMFRKHQPGKALSSSHTYHN